MIVRAALLTDGEEKGVYSIRWVLVRWVGGQCQGGTLLGEDSKRGSDNEEEGRTNKMSV
jgi:hypothetical protein